MPGTLQIAYSSDFLSILIYNKGNKWNDVCSRQREEAVEFVNTNAS